MRRPRWVLPWLLATAAAAAADDPGPGCSARYDVSQGGATVPGVGVLPSTVVVGDGTVDLEGWCRLEGVKRKNPGRSDVVLRRRFKRCGALRAGVFEARIRSGCNSMTAVVKLKRKPRRVYFGATRHVPPGTLHTIEDRILSERGCAVSTCHGSAREIDLDLRPGAAYASLVGVAPVNAAAATAGKLRVAPGDTARSFLSAKLHGTLGVDEGAQMPLGDDPLSTVEIALVDAWIAAGAPEAGHVEGAPELPPRIYEETPPLAPPPGGYQLVLEGPVLQPGQEQEGCLWVPAPNPTDLPIAKIEIALNPGTHHFAVWRHAGPTPPPLGTWLANDIACLGSGATFGQQIGGAPHAPYFLAEQPPGFATVLPGGGYIGLNAHYYNESSGPIQIKVWTNFYPYPGTPEHLAKGIPIALDASSAINVAPFTQATVRGRLVNDSGATMYVMAVGGHMHKRGVRFSIWQSDGTKVHDDYDWAHPSFHGFTPPLALAPGDRLDYECLHDNGVTRPVHRDGAGAPGTLVFGVSAEDEMCILTGQYYQD